MNRKVTVAIIGCGQISDAHLSEVALIPEAEVVAVCDLIKVLADDTADRFDIPYAYCDYKKMITDLHLDVVHITTPPHTHLTIGLDVINNGCHAYIEKPFGLNYQQAKELIEAAKNNKVIVCAGFSQFYDLVSLRCQEFIKSGSLGEVVHVETFYGNSMDGSFSRLFLQDKEHWIHKLPGKLFQNIISHAMYHVIPFFPGPMDQIVCFAQDRSKNGVFQDELRVMMHSGNVTGYLTFTSAVRPVTQFIKIYGTKAIVEVDLVNHIFSYLESTDLPGPIARARNAIIPGRHLIGEGIKNIRNMMIGKDRFFAGMGNLFKQLYKNIRQGAITPPVPYSYVLNVSAVMDEIANQCQKIESVGR